ncbi:MAG: transporter substrate-binding domain-containing protein [Alysiella sp.]|uniref:substrate-binding periplasmic protein n=1 Tax=Alysiella sp. TaxID=1872483 RepID=UPI0026DBAA5B|nr:transporter substrate-binding domain-containing protein [Alysiella sp.]MDO4434006.1 transporter substrate-binding domain-containing protein [Alysiella sp.]
MKLHHLFVSAVLSVALSACDGSESQKTTEVKPQSSQTASASSAQAASNLSLVQVGTDAKYPPFQYRDEKSKILGIEMDILNAIGKSQGLGMEFNHFAREEWHKSLQNGTFDMWASAFYGNAEYPDDVLVSKPFMDAYIVVGLCDDKEGNANIQNIEQLKGKKLAVSKYYGQKMIDLAAKLTGSPENVMVTDTFYLSARELYNKQVDGVLGANYVLAYFAQEMKKEQSTRLLRVHDEEPRHLVFLVKKDKPELLEKLNKGIDVALADGTIKAVQDKWLKGLNAVQ